MVAIPRKLRLFVLIVRPNFGCSTEEIYKRIKIQNPKIISLVVYGQNVNAGTTNMSGAITISNFIKSKVFDEKYVDSTSAEFLENGNTYKKLNKLFFS